MVEYTAYQKYRLSFIVFHVALSHKKALATLRLTAPTDQDTVDTHLRSLQKHADGLVFGRRRWLTGESAAQPRHALGVGHLHVQKYMQATWAQPLLASMGRDQERRPYKHYFAR